MKRFISHFIIALSVIVSFSNCDRENIVSFSNCDRENNELFEEKNGFIEVTIDGKTYKSDVEIWNAGIIEEWGKETLCRHENFADFHDYGFDIYFIYTRYANINKLLDCPLGEYPFVHQGMPEEAENFALEIFEYDSPTQNCDSWNCEKGTHKVTSIKKKGGKVVVEGTFDATFGDNELCISGKYQIAFDNIED